MFYITISILFLFSLIFLYYYLKRVTIGKLPINAPSRISLKELQQYSSRILFAGDSNTHGNMGYNWTNDISTKALKINAGVNADLSITLLRRIDEILACSPMAVTILIGTNDVNASMNEKSQKRYIDNNKITKSDKIGIDAFSLNLSSIVGKLKAAQIRHIALLSLPPIGEDLDHEANIKADNYSKEIQNIATKFKVDFIDIRTQLKNYINLNQKSSPPPYEGYFLKMQQSLVLHYYFRWSWDKISIFHGNLLSQDLLHQNSIAGKIISKNVNTWLKSINL